MKNLQVNLKYRCIAIRKALGLTQNELSKKSGISIRHIQEIEAGKVDLRLTTLEKLAQSLGVEPYQLICNKENKKHERGLCKTADDTDVFCINWESYFDPLDAFSVGLMVSDVCGKVWYVNAKTTQINGTPREEIVGKMYIWDFLETPEQKEGLKKYLAFLIQEKPFPSPYVAVVRSRSGQQMSVRADWSYIFGTKGKVEGFFGVLHTEIYR